MTRSGLNELDLIDVGNNVFKDYYNKPDYDQDMTENLESN